MKILSLLTFFLFTSCASYMQKVHKQIDSEDNARRRAYQQNRYKNNGRDYRPIKNPVTLGSSQQRNMRPSVRRNYNQSVGKRRYKANDLKDNGSDGSLWSGQNSENFLFVTNNLKRRGDIVIIEVMNSMKDKIQDELKRAFPDRPKKKSSTAAKEEVKKEEAPATANAEENSPQKIHDKISTTVVELVNQDYLLIRGRKEVMFKKRKRFVEIQAVVSQKDISSGDTISSEKALEPKINVLRY